MLKSNRTVLLVWLEIGSALGSIPLIGWVMQSNGWYLAGSIGIWLFLYVIYRSAITVTIDRGGQ